MIIIFLSCGVWRQYFFLLDPWVRPLGQIRNNTPMTYQRVSTGECSPELQGNIPTRSWVATWKSSDPLHLKDSCRCATGIGRCCTNCHCLQLKTGYIHDLHIGLLTQKIQRQLSVNENQLSGLQREREHAQVRYWIQILKRWFSYQSINSRNLLSLNVALISLESHQLHTLYV